MIDTMQRLLTADEAAQLLRVGRFRIHELARTGAIPVVRIGRQVRFSPAALAAYIAGGGKALGGGGGWQRAEDQ